MVKLELLSDNLVIAIEALLENQNVCKLLYYNDKFPLEKPDIDNTKILMLENIYPYAFDLSITDVEKSFIHVFYPEVIIKAPVVENPMLYFDVIVNKKLWLININDKSKIRPYEIMWNIIDTFDNKAISTLGRLNFRTAKHIMINEQFDGLRLIATSMNIVTGR